MQEERDQAVDTSPTSVTMPLAFVSSADLSRMVPGTLSQVAAVIPSGIDGKICLTCTGSAVGLVAEVKGVSGGAALVRVEKRCERVPDSLIETNPRGYMVGKFSFFSDDPVNEGRVDIRSLIFSIKGLLDRHGLDQVGEAGRRIFVRSLLETGPGLMGSVEESFLLQTSNLESALPPAYTGFEKISFLFMHIVHVPDESVRNVLLFSRDTRSRLEGILRYFMMQQDNKNWSVLISPAERLVYKPIFPKTSLMRPSSAWSSILLVLVVLLVLVGKGQGWWGGARYY